METKLEKQAPFKVVCLTGGPCGGKTSAISIITDLFESLGWTVYRVPETAAILLGGGVQFAELDDESAFSFQKHILSVMLSLEKTYRDLALLNSKKGIKTVVICDRGTMDPSAYMPRKDWLRVVKDLNMDEVSLRDHRYDCVVHLVTAAKGAESFYTLENNNTRSEVMNAWVGHSSFHVIDNLSVNNFTEKCDKIVQVISNAFGLTTMHNLKKGVKKHKFWIQNFKTDMDFPVTYREFEVEHRYLVNTSGDGTQTRIRRRIELGTNNIHCNMTTRYTTPDGFIYTRRHILAREYELFKNQSDPTRVPIKKLRRCFLYEDQYFQLDVYQSPSAGLVLMETYLSEDIDPSACIPPWLEYENVTDDNNYSMFTLAEKKNNTSCLGFSNLWNCGN
ncbi:AAA domain-containing protein [Globomyces pollinis-pini]|nr:AAA domain-containing protein [Globomyces pollinis-pini]